MKNQKYMKKHVVNKCNVSHYKAMEILDAYNLACTKWSSLYGRFLAGDPGLNVVPAVECIKNHKRFKKYHFSELVDISLIDKLLHECYSITSVANALLDADGNNLSATGWQDICTKFHRIFPATEKNCRQSDLYILNHLQDGSYVEYKCLNGINDCAIPIVVEGQHLATIYIGQFLHEPADKEYFRMQAREYGFDEAAYMKALEQIPIISEEHLDNIMEFYSQLVKVITNMGLERVHQMEAAEDKFSKAFNCCPDPITITTLEGYYIEVNDAWVEISGYERHEAIGHSSLELGIWITSEDRNQMLKRIFEDGIVRDFESRYRAKSGEVGTYIVSTEILNIDGIPHLLSVHKDITDRKKYENALSLSVECFSKAFNASPIILYITTVTEDGLFIDVNDCFCGTFGLIREEVIGKTPLDVGFRVNPDDWILINDMMIEKQAVRDMEMHFETKDREKRLGLYSAERIDIDGQDCVLSIVIDITERKQMEVEMNRLDRLNLVGEMAASIGHEIRNPMTTVRGYLQILKSKREYAAENGTFELMIDELDRANGIITEFLSLAKHKLIQLESANLNMIIKNILPLIKVHAMAQDKKIELKVGDIPELLLDKKEIRQLLLNLVRNGLEAMPAGGILTIRTIEKDEHIILSVEDQGEGIAPEVLEKLGTPFFSTKEQGTGLGLAVCYGIAKRHNASIRIKTGSHGTAFNIEFLNPKYQRENVLGKRTSRDLEVDR